MPVGGTVGRDYRFVIPIPNNATLGGLQLFTQAFVLDAGANALQLVVSNGAPLVVGT